LPYANEKWQLKTCQKHKKQHASQKPKIKASKTKKAAQRTAFFAKTKLKNTFSEIPAPTKNRPLST
jgi:hypothetical protein